MDEIIHPPCPAVHVDDRELPGHPVQGLPAVAVDECLLEQGSPEGRGMEEKSQGPEMFFSLVQEGGGKTGVWGGAGLHVLSAGHGRAGERPPGMHAVTAESAIKIFHSDPPDHLVIFFSVDTSSSRSSIS